MVHSLIWNIPYRSVGVKGLKVTEQGTDLIKSPIIISVLYFWFNTFLGISFTM